MNILLYTWSDTGQKNIISEFMRLGYNVDQIILEYKDLDNDREFSLKFIKYLKQKKYDFVFSYNYFPIISNVCNEINIKYVSWVWDSPLLTLYSKTVFNKCNYIFIFDKALYYDLKNKGIDQVYYLPLGADVESLYSIDINDTDKKKFSSDISFIGDLYVNKNFYDKINYLPDYIKGYLDGIMQSQLRIYGYNFLEELLTDDILNEIKKYVKFELGENYFANDAIVFANLFLGQKVTSLERVNTLDILSKLYPIDLYTSSNTGMLQRVNNKGYVDYNKEMPKVFKLSKINLNMTLKTIKTGIPLRVFDIMGSGGFLLTNFQQELLDYFEPNKDFVYYEDIDDLINKIDYYLSHDEERCEIAHNGYQKVKSYHTIRLRINKILETIKLINMGRVFIESTKL
jgi:spore maturation protein CgeB